MENMSMLLARFALEGILEQIENNAVEMAKNLHRRRGRGRGWESDPNLKAIQSMVAALKKGLPAEGEKVPGESR